MRGIVRLVAIVLISGSLGIAPARAADIFANWLDGADGHERAMDRRKGTSDAVLLYFYTDWCPHCRRFNQTIAASPEMQEYVRRTIAVRINPEQGEREKALADHYGVTGFPTLLVLAHGAGQPMNVSGSRGSPAAFVSACEAAGRKSQVKTTPSAPAPATLPPARRETPPAASAQKANARRQPPTVQAKNVVHLKNGNVIAGTVQWMDDQDLDLDVEGVGEMTFSRDEILSVDGPAPHQQPVEEDAP